MPKYDLLITRGRTLDPESGLDGVRDVAVRLGRIEAVERELDRSLAAEVIDLSAAGWPRRHPSAGPLWLMPGMVDTHVHVAGRFPGVEDCSPGLRMAVEAGATTLIDMGGTVDRLVDGMRRAGCGASAGSLLVLKPGETVGRDDPPPSVVRAVLGDALRAGSLGIKMWGGYHPFTPEVTADVIAACNEEGVYAAYHVGTKETGSRLDGLRELPGLLGSRGRVHVAHVNAYCRGSVLPPHEEVVEALEILASLRRQTVSEAHLALPNFTLGTSGASGRVLADVARNCLRLRGYAETADGVRRALRDGYASAVAERDGRLELVTGEAGVAVFDEMETDCSLSFPVNRADSAFQLTVAKEGQLRASGDGTAVGADRFVVDAVASDAGVFPRNVNVEQSLRLFRFGGLTPLEIAAKLSYNPARMLGMARKGRVSPGADADFTVVDPASGRAGMGIVAGEVIMRDGVATGAGGRLLVTPAGKRAARTSGLPFEVVEVSQGLLYGGR